ncbi:MAG: class I SAM-dependent methyltransferase [Nannocystaceae bacterium]|nr:class I SAM-dependent methyltransferase [Nannocystaceae bacterium]
MVEARTQGSQSYLSEPQIHEQWESDYLNPDIEAFYEASFDAIVQRLGVPPGATLLDAGCGYCLHAARYARRGLEVTGVDFSAAALRAARENLDRTGLAGKIELVEGNLLELPFPDGRFDVVSCWGVLMHIPEVERALSELVRVLKPGGKLVLMENNADSLHVQLFEPALRTLKRVLRRKVPDRERTPRGVEEWMSERSGGLMVRKVDVAWLEGFLAERGCHLVDRFAGQLTEMYTALPLRALKRAIYQANLAYLRHGGNPRLAMGNILIFAKD